MPRLLIQFQYDYQGRRIYKRILDTTSPTNIQYLGTWYYLYDHWNLIAEYRSPDNTPPKNMTFGVSAHVGRFNYPQDDHIDREMVVEQLLNGGGEFGLTEDDILPLPAFLPWGLQVHPDCGVHVPFLRAPWGTRPLNHLIDMAKLYHRLSQSRRQKPSRLNRTLVPAWHMLRSIRPGQRLRFLRTALGLARKKDTYSLVNVAVTNYRAASFLDTQRIGRCASSFLTSQGPVSACLHFYMNEKFPGSREYEAAHGSC